MKKILKLTLLLFGVLLATNSFAGMQKTYKYADEKKISKQFTVSPGVELIIENKFGDIVVVEGKSNEVKIDITIKVSSTNEEYFQGMMNGIDIYINKSGNTIRSLLMRRRIGGTYNRLKSNTQIDYLITAPKGYVPNIDNSHGDIELDEVTSEANIDISFGKLKINKVEKLNLKSRFSNVDIGEVNIMRVYKFSFGKLFVKKLNTNLDCGYIGHSRLTIDECSNNIEKIYVDGSFTPIKITLPETLKFKSSLKTSFGKVRNSHYNHSNGQKEKHLGETETMVKSDRDSSKLADIDITTSHSNINIL